MVCEHYQAECQIFSECCKKFHDCRICHDKNEYHFIDRYSIKTIRCNECKTEQNKSQTCMNCGKKFSENYCGQCNIWCEFEIFHCKDCNVCFRLNDEERFHCQNCGICFEKKNDHDCSTKLIHRDDECSVCMDPLFFNTRQAIFPKCGHAIHSDCFHQLIQVGDYKCPLCKKTMLDIDWDDYSLFIDMHKIQEQKLVGIICNDCLERTENLYHPFGVQCKNCKSYNTMRQ